MVEKVRVLSVGIGKYWNAEKLEPLPCAVPDSKLIFDTLLKVLDGSVDLRGSVAIGDISAQQFRMQLELLFDVDPNGRIEDFVYVIYFSGHGDAHKDVLDLKFVDAYGTRGSISVNEIEDSIRKAGYPNVLLILDCCYSGSAKELVFEGINKRKTTIVTSSESHQRSKQGKGYSIFTDSFARILNLVHQKGLPISLSHIADHIDKEAFGSQTPQVIFPIGRRELTLAGTPIFGEPITSFVEDIVRKIGSSEEEIREALWYSLAEEKEHILLGVAKLQLSRQNFIESSWLVRRAMGSAIASVRYNVADANKICLDLLTSDEWTNRCIGLIAARNRLQEKFLENQFLNILISGKDRMDARWLAFLYLCDFYENNSFGKLYSHVVQTPFFQTAWGICELWEGMIGRRGKSEGETFEGMLEKTRIFLDLIKHGELGNELQRYLFYNYNNIYVALMQGIQSPELSIPFSDVDCFSVSRMRGNSGAVGIGKWLKSSLYGTWRGSYKKISVFDTMPRNELLKFLEAGEFLPMAGARMALFEQAFYYGDEPCGFADVLSWGAADAHPWVRRVALIYYSRIASKIDTGQCINFLRSACKLVDPFTYPGKLDLLRECLRFANQLGLSQEGCQDICGDIVLQISKSELAALNRDSEVEHRPYRF
jgi:hypothetical protein